MKKEVKTSKGVTTNVERYDKLCKKLEKEGRICGNTLELINVRTKFCPYGHAVGCVSEAYLNHELDWYESQDLCIKGHAGIETNKIWKRCATAEGMVNSNYGWCILSPDNYNQLDNAIAALIDDADTRQSICVYTRPSIQRDHNDGIHARHDMICTAYTQHFIRRNKLHYIVNMRSNDIRYGLPYDLEWHKYIYNRMSNRLRSEKYPSLGVGWIYWNAGSLHRYI